MRSTPAKQEERLPRVRIVHPCVSSDSLSHVVRDKIVRPEGHWRQTWGFFGYTSHQINNTANCNIWQGDVKKPEGAPGFLRVKSLNIECSGSSNLRHRHLIKHAGNGGNHFA